MRAGVTSVAWPVIALAVVACGPRSAPATTISSVPSPGTPSSEPAPGSAWSPLEVTTVPCPDGGDDECVEVTLPARGSVRFEGATPHYWGCGNYDDGVIVATASDQTLTLTMTAPGRDLHTGEGQCRALAVLRGQGTAGPLAPGRWLLMPSAPDRRQPDNLAPLALETVTFAAAP